MIPNPVITTTAAAPQAVSGTLSTPGLYHWWGTGVDKVPEAAGVLKHPAVLK